MEKYIVNYLADIDIAVEASSPDEAREKAEQMFGEYYNKQFDYVYLSEIQFIAKPDGTEVR